MLSFADRVLGLRLGLGDLGNTASACMGFANACVCSECLKREEMPKPQAPAPQPWETAA